MMILNDLNMSLVEQTEFELTEENKNKEEDNKKTLLDPELDSDNDGISDDLEINGYTVENGIIVKWDESKHKAKGLPKYFSDPYHSHTAGDPYSDVEKVLGKFDGLLEARNPLVAAYPRITVEMEKIIFSKNVTVTNEQGQTASQEKSNTIGLATSNSHTDSTTSSISTNITAHASLLDAGVSASVTDSFSNESSNTVTTEKSSSMANSQGLAENVTKSLALNRSEVALLNGNIRYTNIGTIPIYNLKPTLNFVLGIGSETQTIATISAKTNTLAKVVAPNQKYPVAKQNAVSWNTSDDFNAQPIKLNYEQVVALVEWSPLQIQTTQIEGEYKKYAVNGEQYVTQDFKWEYVLPDIYQKTALLTIAFLDGQTFERRVAANNFNSTELQLPKLTIKEAIEMAFAGAKVENNIITYKEKEIKKENLHITIDRETNRILSEQNKKSLFDAILTKEMKIMFIEEDQAKNNEEFKKIQEKLKFFDGSTYENFLDLQNKVSFDSDLGVDGQLLTEAIRRYLLSNNISVKIINDLLIEYPNGWGQGGNPVTLRRDDFKPDDFKTWFKTVTVEYLGVKSNKFKLYFRNILTTDMKEIKTILDQAVKKLSTFDGSDDAHRFDLNNVIHLATDLGENGNLLSHVLQTYLIVNGLFSSVIVDNINFIFTNFKGKTLAENGFKNAEDKTWCLKMIIKYHNDWQSPELKIYFKNVRSVTDWFVNEFHTLVSVVGNYVGQGIDNWFSSLANNSDLQKVAQVSQMFNMLGKLNI